ncbi:hypothetical protein CDIK_3294 [Cucumispora dikerogammari]|nr:hypothetical protein CDIK_3294 [Cucumispora dikerogammari]
MRDQVCDLIDWILINFNDRQIGKKSAWFFVISIILVILVSGSMFWLFEKHFFPKHFNITGGNTIHTINTKRTKDNTLDNSRKDTYIGGIVDKESIILTS